MQLCRPQHPPTSPAVAIRAGRLREPLNVLDPHRLLSSATIAVSATVASRSSPMSATFPSQALRSSSGRIDPAHIIARRSHGLLFCQVSLRAPRPALTDPLRSRTRRPLRARFVATSRRQPTSARSADAGCPEMPRICATGSDGTWMLASCQIDLRSYLISFRGEIAEVVGPGTEPDLGPPFHSSGSHFDARLSVRVHENK